MDERLKNMIARAQQGDIKAMTVVGDCYNKGVYTEKDNSKAHFYYKMAADAGHVKAAAFVAIDYLEGIGVVKDKKEGVKYLQFAADNGNAFAQYNLGYMYQQGEIGLFFKKDQAIYYYELAAKQGDAKAQIELALMIWETKKGTMDDVVFWLVCAYLHGLDQSPKESNTAMQILNNMMQSGLPGGRDYVEKTISRVKTQYPSYMKSPY